MKRFSPITSTNGRDSHCLQASRAKAFDLFSGCGGLTLGLQLAGFDVVGAIEVDRKAQETYAMNHPGVRLYGEDIRKLDASAVMKEIGLMPGDLSLLAGCPPCQGFSRLRTKNKMRSVYDPRNDLVSEFLRFAEVMLPKSIMLENVPALKDDFRFENLVKRLAELEYNCVVEVVDAARYGVPQRRKRLILLASRYHVPRLAKESSTQVTVRAALAGFEDPRSSSDQLHALPERRSDSVKRLIELIPKDGGSRKDLPDELVLPCHRGSDGFRDVYGRMAWDTVAPTITSGCHNPSKGRFIHPGEDRTVTLREASVLQGFPRNYRFDTSHGKEAIALMIGNALPPPFIAAHAEALLSVD
ncbi:DNA (cytosine-5-)-methyltransferase [Xanthomonas arboricola]|uniref:DNA cytosine methyltransferase n=1 Tax=Xanthomonas arboricola TaxID=56448 RepID=UPI000CEF00BE|nr:DNA cytosine methyltransferase [Xanthomonas arboricola]PPU34130.1 DNA (cytosine-5-)-methyltransferase [Xanthomonas arboricola]